MTRPRQKKVEGRTLTQITKKIWVDQWDFLRAEALRSGKSESMLIRDAIDKCYKLPRKPNNPNS